MSIKEMTDKFDAIKSTMVAELKTELLKESIDWFEANPTYDVIEWVQYIPYFNDGAPCKFSVGEISASSDDQSVFISEYTNRSAADFLRDISDIPRDILQTVFGENVAIQITKDGITVGEYDCGY